MEQQKGLKTTTIWLMIGVAAFFDALQALLSWIFLGWLIIPVEYGTFWLWFKFNGISFFSMKRAPALGIGALIEIVTAGIFPAFTAVVARIALTSKIKEVASPREEGRVVGSIGQNVDNQSNLEKAA